MLRRLRFETPSFVMLVWVLSTGSELGNVGTYFSEQLRNTLSGYVRYRSSI